MDTKTFLKTYNIRYLTQNDRIIVNDDRFGTYYNGVRKNLFDLNYITYIPNNLFNDCTIEGDLLLNGLNLMSEGSFNNCIINGYLSLNGVSIIHNNCLNNCTIKGNLYLIGITYLPKIFNVKVEGEIFLDNLKSKTLKNLIKKPGASRQLAFNILNNL